MGPVLCADVESATSLGITPDKHGIVVETDTGAYAFIFHRIASVETEQGQTIDFALYSVEKLDPEDAELLHEEIENPSEDEQVH